MHPLSLPRVRHAETVFVDTGREDHPRHIDMVIQTFVKHEKLLRTFTVKRHFNFVEVSATVAQLFGCIDDCLFAIEFIATTRWADDWLNDAYQTVSGTVR